MEKRYQVFVSSTYDDLRVERQEVMQALLELDCIPSGMELFPAADEDQWTLIKRMIDDCDYYMVIIAGRYGSLGPAGTSYTQMEYEYAASVGKPVVAFLHSNPGEIPINKTDPANSDKLNVFRGLVQKRVCKFWGTPQELGSVVSRSIVKLIKQRPGIGWVRANLVSDESAAVEILRLRNENDELKRALEQAKSEPPKGSEAFASGDECIELHFEFNSAIPAFERETIRMSWNGILAVLGPLMINGASEQGLKQALGNFFRNLVFDRRAIKIHLPSIREEDFQKIKVQFRALKWITKDESTPDKKMWILTPHGDFMLTQVAAIRSSKGTQSQAE